MPIFEYQCEKCNNLKDEWHKHDDVIIVTCKCGTQMDRLISAPNIVMPVYRPEELVKKKDTKNAEQDYTRKLTQAV